MLVEEGVLIPQEVPLRKTLCCCCTHAKGTRTTPNLHTNNAMIERCERHIFIIHINSIDPLQRPRSASIRYSTNPPGSHGGGFTRYFNAPHPQAERPSQRFNAWPSPRRHSASPKRRTSCAPPKAELPVWHAASRFIKVNGSYLSPQNFQ